MEENTIWITLSLFSKEAERRSKENAAIGEEQQGPHVSMKMTVRWRDDEQNNNKHCVQYSDEKK